MKNFNFLIFCFLLLLAACQNKKPELEKTIILPDGSTLEMVYVAPGNFLMGSDKDEIERHGDEDPVRNVTIDKGFYLGKYELTQAQWKAIMKTNPSIYKNFEDSDQHPVDNVSWDDANIYIGELNTLNLG